MQTSLSHTKCEWAINLNWEEKKPPETQQYKGLEVFKSFLTMGENHETYSPSS